MANYCMTVGGQDYELRLSAKTQAKLESKYNDGIVSIIFDSLDRISVRAELFSAALSYNGNANPIRDGFDFCDALIEDGVAGSEGFARILLEMAYTSGIISETVKNKSLARLEDVFADEDETGDEENPTAATD
ncbi:MAG: hypothetical protein LUC35_00250 [Clostridiales bacterium]|nr:hypothetical protein [Clostridiales bacterium]